MPLVEVKVFEDELTPEQKTQLIQRITDAVTTVTSEKLRDVTGRAEGEGEVISLSLSEGFIHHFFEAGVATFPGAVDQGHMGHD